jgi:hypothetical protein
MRGLSLSHHVKKALTCSGVSTPTARSDIPSSTKPKRPGTTVFASLLQALKKCAGPWLATVAIVLGISQIPPLTNEPATEPVMHCTAKVPMTMHPSPAEVKYYGDEKYEHGLVLKAHRAENDKNPISVEDFEKELNQALKKAHVNDHLTVADLMSKDSPLVLVSTKAPVTAKQAVKIFEALHDKMCRYHVSLGDINWPTKPMSKGYEWEGKDIQVPTRNEGYSHLAKMKNEYDSLEDIQKHGLYYYSDDIGMFIFCEKGLCF